MCVQVTVLIFLGLVTITESLPKGCSQPSAARTVCDFRIWSPPLLDSQYNNDPYQIEVNRVSGNFPSQAFSGLAGGLATSDAYIQLDCELSDVSFPANTFTSNLNWVRTLHLIQCYIRNGIAAGTFSSFTGLTSLQVTQSLFGPMNADSFSGLTSLTYVSLQAEFLEKTFPAELLTKLTAVTTIIIRSSSLTSIPYGAFDGLTRLVSLDLSGNLLTSLPVGAFDSLLSLTSLTLDANNWNCGCHFTWLSTWLLYSGVTATLTCSSPAAYKGFRLNRAIAALGCTTSTTTPVTKSYVLEATALIFAGMALVVAALMGIALCYYRSMSKAEAPETKVSGKSGNQGKTPPKQSSDIDKKTSEEVTNYRNKDVEKADDGADKRKWHSSVSARQVIVSPRPLIDVEYKKMPPLFPGFRGQW